MLDGMIVPLKIFGYLVGMAMVLQEQVCAFGSWYTNTYLKYLLTAIGLQNDLWRYNVNDDTWTWMSGSNRARQSGVYGEKGKPSIANVPGARRTPFGWYDSSTKEFWLFGGDGYGNTSTNGTSKNTY